jgi:hypothetical protein
MRQLCRKIQKPIHVAGEWVRKNFKKLFYFRFKYHSPDVPDMGHEQHELS